MNQIQSTQFSEITTLPSDPPAGPVPVSPTLPPAPPTPSSASHVLSLARHQFPAGVHERKQKFHRFMLQLTESQRSQLWDWLRDLPLSEAQRRIAAPLPDGFGLQVPYSTLSRCKASMDTAHITTRAGEALDHCHDLFDMNEGFSLSPIHDALALHLHTRALELAQRDAPTPDLLQVLSALAKIERLSRPRPEPRTSAPRLSHHRVELSVAQPGSTALHAHSAEANPPTLKNLPPNTLAPATAQLPNA